MKPITNRRIFKRLDKPKKIFTGNIETYEIFWLGQKTEHYFDCLFYRGSRSGLVGRLIGLLCWSDIVHCEIRFMDGVHFSAEADEQKTVKYIPEHFDKSKWRIVRLYVPEIVYIATRKWFEFYTGVEYDFDCIASYIIPLWKERQQKLQCAEYLNGGLHHGAGLLPLYYRPTPQDIFYYLTGERL